MKLFFIALLFVFVESAFAQTSYVAPSTILGRQGSQIGIQSEYFSSTKRINKDGKKLSFENGEAFSRLQSEFSGFYGLTENFQIGGGVRARQNRSTAFIPATSKTNTETATGLESTYLSLKYAFRPVDRVQYTLEGLYRFHTFSNEENSPTGPGSLVLGDDGNEYSGGLSATYSSVANNFLTGRVGYRKPGQDLSSEIYWQVEAAVAWTHVALIAGVDGVSSMKNDPYKDDLANRSQLNTGTTALYHSVNREFIAPYGGVNFAMGQDWRVELRGSQVLSGKSTDLGTAFGISLIRRVDEGKKTKTDRKFKEYDIEASVTKVSPKMSYVVIDKGLSEDVRKGMKIDFFEFDYVGGNILLATGTVVQSKAESAVVKITQRFNTKREFKVGVVARGSYR